MTWARDNLAQLRSHHQDLVKSDNHHHNITHKKVHYVGFSPWTAPLLILHFQNIHWPCLRQGPDTVNTANGHVPIIDTFQLCGLFPCSSIDVKLIGN